MSTMVDLDEITETDLFFHNMKKGLLEWCEAYEAEHGHWPSTRTRCTEYAHIETYRELRTPHGVFSCIGPRGIREDELEVVEENPIKVVWR